MFVFMWFMLVLFIILVGFIVLYVSIKHYLKKNKDTKSKIQRNDQNESSVK